MNYSTYTNEELVSIIAAGDDAAYEQLFRNLAPITLDWYETKQPEKDCRCPRCGEIMWGPKTRYALSRHAAITVCDRCGMEEALEQAGIAETKPLMKWCAVELPAVGGGAWRR